MMSPVQSSVVVIRIRVLFLIVLNLCIMARGYTCTDETVDSSPTISANENVAISGCTFNTAVTITTPASIVINGGSSKTTFKAGLTINGDSSVPFTGSFSMKNFESPASLVTISSIVSGDISIQRSSFHSLTIIDCIFDKGNTVTIEDSGITTAGLALRTTTFHGGPTTRFTLLNSFVTSSASNANAIRLHRTTFSESSLMVIANSVVRSTHTHVDSIYFHSDSNSTESGRQRFYNTSMFDTGARLVFSNSTVQAENNGKAIATYHKRRLGDVDNHHYGFVSRGAKVVGVNSRFLSFVELYLTEGASVELDAATYDAVEIQVIGDNEEHIVIPIPHTISVKSVQLIKCRVHLSDINVPRPTTYSWKVEVSALFELGNLCLDMSQTLQLRSATDVATPPYIQLHNINVSSFGGIVIANSSISGLVLTGCTLVNGSFVLVENVAVSGGSAKKLQLSQSSLSFGSFLLLSNVTTQSNVALSRLSVSSNSSIVLNHSILSTGISVFASTFDDGSELSIVSSAVKAPATFVDAIFVSSSLCIASSRIMGGNVGGMKFGTVNFYSSGSRSYSSDTQMFLNGSRFSISNSVIDTVKGYSLFNYNTYSYQYRDYKSRVYFGSQDGDPLGTTMVLHNSTIGKLPLLNVRGNFTAFIDSQTLGRSQLRFTGQATTLEAARESVVHIPPQVAVWRLVLQGVWLEWESSRVLETLQSTGLIEASNVSFTSPPLLDLQVSEGLELMEPFHIALNNQQLRVRPPSSMPNATATIDVHLSDVSNGSSVLISGFEAAVRIAVGGSFRGGHLMIANCTTTTSVSTRAPSTFTKASSLVVVNVVAGSSVIVDGTEFHDQSVVVTEGTTTGTLQLIRSQWHSGSQMHILRVNVTATHFYAFYLLDSIFSGEKTLLNVVDSSFETTPNVSPAMYWYASRYKVSTGAQRTYHYRYNALDNDATARFVDVRIKGGGRYVWTNYRPKWKDIVYYYHTHYAFINGSVVLENVDFGGQAMLLYGRGGSVTFGEGITNLKQLDMRGATASLGGTADSEFGCSAASNTTICTRALTSGDVKSESATDAAASVKSATDLANDASTKISEESEVAEVIDDKLTERATFSDGVVKLLAETRCRTMPGALASDGAPEVPSNLPTGPHTLENTRSTSLFETIESTLSRSRGTLRSDDAPLIVTRSTTRSTSTRSTSVRGMPIPSSSSSQDQQHTSSTLTAVHSSTIILSLESPASLTPTTMRPTPTNGSEPTTPQRVRTVSVLLPENEVAATIVLSTAGASGAVASTFGSGGAGVVVTAGSSVRMMDCGMAEDDPRPASFELPIQFAAGSGTMSYFAGAALAHTLLQCVLLVTTVLLRRRLAVGETHTARSEKVVRLASMMFCGSHPFFTPAILGACSTVLNNDDDSWSLAAAAASALIIVFIHGLVVLAVHRGPANGLVAHRGRSGITGVKAKIAFKARSDSSDTTTEGLLFSAQATKDILLALFDGCRHFEKASHRHYASIETTVYSVIAIISGARPEQSCSTAAFAIGGLATAQLFYVVFVRPFRTRLDMIFSVLNGTVLLVLSMAVAISVQSKHSDVHLKRATKTVEICLWLVSSLGFVQLAVQGYWAYHVGQRRRHLEDSSSGGSTSTSNSSGEDENSESDTEDTKTKPLLVPVVEIEQREGVELSRGTHSEIPSERGRSAVTSSKHWNPLVEEGQEGNDHDMLVVPP